MACPQWKDEWVARLYDELETDESQKCDAHLEDCADCRRSLEQLAAARQLLQACDEPPLGATRLAPLPTRSVWHGTWSFATGALCALLAFALGLLVASRLPATSALPPAVGTDRAPDPGASASWATISREVERLRELQAACDRRIAALEEAPGPLQTGDGAHRLTRNQLEEELARLERRFDREREADLQALVRSMTAVEMRTGSWIDETREALQLLALRQDPRFQER